MLPFGNIVVTLDVNGGELKTMLENGVSLSVDPATLGNSGQGRFPQVSGLCFTTTSPRRRATGSPPR